MNAESQHNPGAAISASQSAGALLRQYRQTRGVEPETLASSLHVPVGRIQALEEDRFDAMPDIMFPRALAMSVCRYLKVDATAVLARMPQQDASRIATRDERGIDSPLSRPSLLPDGSVQILQRLLDIKVVAAAVVVLGLLYLWIQPGNRPEAASTPITPAATDVAPVPAPGANAETTSNATEAPPSAPAAAASAVPAVGQPIPPGPQTVTTPVAPAGGAK